jgi:hypothetical protein
MVRPPRTDSDLFELLFNRVPREKPAFCPKCKGYYFIGDFPFCKGRVEDHHR